MSTRHLVVYLAAVGAAAGFLAWTLLVWLAGMLFEASRPGGLSLLLAVPRGALFGVILGLILRAIWRRA